ncbi:hypothetical protein [Lentisalinibacter sediminis]|uniref:hypothetical protein n=1 Tax=Lentisalinibacter sediminis TaxID=2992237 RepID=UPI00386CA0F5
MPYPPGLPLRLLAIAVAGIGVLLLGHLLPLGGGSYIGQSLRDSLHGLAFFVFTLIIFRLALPRLGVYGAALFAAATSLLAGPAGELAQWLTGKEFSLRDIGQDALGAAAAVCLMIGRHGWRQGRLRAERGRAVMAGGGFLLVVVLAPVVWWTWVLAGRASAAPVIADFEGAWETALITAGERVSTPAGWPAPGDYVLRVETPARKYAGVQFRDPYPHWGGATALRFVASTGDGESHQLTLRIHDERHDNRFADRFNRTFPIGPEPREFCIPMNDIENAPEGRRMDLNAIAEMTAFLIDTDGTEVFLLDRMRLSYAPGGCSEPS